MSKTEEPVHASALRLVADSASMQGRSPKQEDRHVKIPDLTKAAKALKMPIDHLEQPCALFGVYDGHQGHLCVEYVAKGFHIKLLKKLSASSDGWTDERFCTALSQVCEELDTEFLTKYRTAIDGCAVVVALIVGTRVFVAWVGHARCLVCKQAELGEVVPIALTQDHRPSVEAEAERVRKAGGIVVDYGGGFARVAHEGYEERLRELRRAKALGFGTIGKEPVALDVSRSLGDREFKAVTGKALLIPTPGIRSFQLDHSHSFVALTCGGVPCVLSDEEIVKELDLVRDEADLVADVRANCGALVQEAYTRGSDNNLTVAMVRLQWPGAANTVARKLAHIEKEKAAAAAPAQASAAAASKRRRLEAAAAISAQKVAAYEKAVSVGEAAANNAAEEARKAAEIAVMMAEVEAAKLEVAKAEAEKLEAAKAQAAEQRAATEEPSPLAAAEAFFAARKSGKKRAADADAAQKAADAEQRQEPEEPKGLDAAEAYFAARRARRAAEKRVEPDEPRGLDAAEAFFAARRASKGEARGASEQRAESDEPKRLEGAEAFFAARRAAEAASVEQPAEKQENEQDDEKQEMEQETEQETKQGEKEEEKSKEKQGEKQQEKQQEEQEKQEEKQQQHSHEERQQQEDKKEEQEGGGATGHGAAPGQPAAEEEDGAAGLTFL